MRMKRPVKNNPLLYMALLYFIFAGIRYSLYMRFALWIFYPSLFPFTIVYALSIALLFFCEEYTYSILNSVNFKMEDHLE